MRERLQKLALLSAMGVTTLNVWTGSPLLALWIGSRVQGRGPPAMLPIFVVAVSMAAVSLVLMRVLGALGARYDDLTGRKPTIRRHTPWLRSMRGERPQEMGADKVGLSALDAVLVASVVIAVLAFEVWFFFFSSSPIDQRSGR
jgi:hypothetical protein